MQFSVTTSSLDKPRVDIRAAGVHHKRKPAPGAATLDALHDGEITALLKAGEMDGETETRLLLPSAGGRKGNALLVGLGAKKDFDAGPRTRPARHWRRRWSNARPAAP